MAALIIASISQIIGNSKSNNMLDTPSPTPVTPVESISTVNTPITSNSNYTFDTPVVSDSETAFDLELDLSSELGNQGQDVAMTESAHFEVQNNASMSFSHNIKYPHVCDSSIPDNQELSGPFMTQGSLFPASSSTDYPEKTSHSYDCFCGRLVSVAEQPDWESRNSMQATPNSLELNKSNFSLSMEHAESPLRGNINSASFLNEKEDLGIESDDFNPNTYHKISGDHVCPPKQMTPCIDEVNNRKIKVHEPEPRQSHLKTNAMMGIGFLEHSGCTVQSEPLHSWNYDVDFTAAGAVNLNLDRSPSRTSCYSDSGVSMYTSTPIKHPENLQGVGAQHSWPASPHSQSGQSISVTPCDSRPGLSLSQTSSFNITPASMCDESLSQILEAGDEEFREKYSSWVSQLFHLQLAKMHRRLSFHFNRKIDALHREKHQQIVDIQQHNRDKLLEFEQATAKFQKWIGVLTEENRRLKSTKDAIVNEMEKSAKQSQTNFQAELECQLNNVLAESEKEKLVLQRKYGQQLKTFLDKTQGQIEKVESEYSGQVEVLNQTIQELQLQKEHLEEQLRAYKKMYESSKLSTSGALAESASTCFKQEKEHLLSVIQEHRNKLQELEREKIEMETSHQEEIDKLTTCNYKKEKGFMLKWEASQRNFELLHRANDNELQMLKSQLSKQEKDSQDIISGLREKYGTKIQELTEMVEHLQFEMEEQEPKL